jgi:hypothetical protein
MFNRRHLLQNTIMIAALEVWNKTYRRKYEWGESEGAAPQTASAIGAEKPLGLKVGCTAHATRAIHSAIAFRAVLAPDRTAPPTTVVATYKPHIHNVDTLRNSRPGASANMDDFNSETDSDYTSYWRDWVGTGAFPLFTMLVPFEDIYPWPPMTIQYLTDWRQKVLVSWYGIPVVSLKLRTVSDHALAYGAQNAATLQRILVFIISLSTNASGWSGPLR